jgi:hypothetical protein
VKIRRRSFGIGPVVSRSDLMRVAVDFSPRMTRQMRPRRVATVENSRAEWSQASLREAAHHGLSVRGINPTATISYSLRENDDIGYLHSHENGQETM